MSKQPSLLCHAVAIDADLRHRRGSVNDCPALSETIMPLANTLALRASTRNAAEIGWRLDQQTGQPPAPVANLGPWVGWLRLPRRNSQELNRRRKTRGRRAWLCLVRRMDCHFRPFRLGA